MHHDWGGGGQLKVTLRPSRQEIGCGPQGTVRPGRNHIRTRARDHFFLNVSRPFLLSVSRTLHSIPSFCNPNISRAFDSAAECQFEKPFYLRALEKGRRDDTPFHGATQGVVRRMTLGWPDALYANFHVLKRVTGRPLVKKSYGCRTDPTI